ncbi:MULTISPECIES: hypothetical protein [Pseudomonadota]|jgi:hypothetical protein|uniref:Uncharacterized protein n=3 Tax=Acinetobacter TaxID=469 RepID=A0A7H2VCZ4_9GAMM|nr:MULTISPECIES: hypothetical protein [Gammaproteobacteria]NWK50427.1 hypothetical protein [Acinetobacter sp. SwsAc7]EFF84491.1 hypothetical protein HMP0015_0032 [Acinetobacter haemolyticus ATCC 19194]EHU1211385.1 hypothetical protein [Acinetobacter nosocomialis]MBJ8465987.1 hypothetical protein [Acinetobacter nosocomialis]MBP1489250.1 hypothetical protein [Acinetobacter nosocomialis]
MSYKVLQGFPWPEPQSDAIGEGEMKAHLQVIFTLDPDQRLTRGSAFFSKNKKR